MGRTHCILFDRYIIQSISHTRHYNSIHISPQHQDKLLNWNKVLNEKDETKGNVDIKFHISVVMKEPF